MQMKSNNFQRGVGGSQYDLEGEIWVSMLDNL